jgi:hypothetical protein
MSKVGKDWRVFSHGVVDKKYEVIIASNIQLYVIDQRTSKDDEGSLLVEILQIDGGRSVANYESRACIFGRSVELFGTRKIENENCRK